jgi:hypothetical protein
MLVASQECNAHISTRAAICPNLTKSETESVSRKRRGDSARSLLCSAHASVTGRVSEGRGDQGLLLSEEYEQTVCRLRAL